MLAIIGLYGLLAYTLRRRRNEVEILRFLVQLPLKHPDLY